MNDPAVPGVLVVVAGALLVLLALVPVAVAQHRRLGGLSLTRVLAFGLLFTELMAVGTYTMLPLPDPAAACTAVPVQPRPFAFLDEVRAGLGGALPGTAAAVAVLQWLLNVALFVPLGALLRRLLGWPALVCVLCGAGLSALVEHLQYTAVLGLFPCRWRTADVDDWVANTLGTAIGVVLATSVLGWVSRHRAGRLRLRPRPVTRRRRLSAMALDLALCLALGLVGWASVRLLLLATERPGLEPSPAVGAALGWWLPGLLLFLLPALGRDAATVGERLTSLRPSWPRGGGPARRALRLGVLGALPSLLGGLAVLDVGGPLVPALLVLWSVALLVAVLVTPRGLDGLLSGAVTEDARDEADFRSGDVTKCR